MLVRVIICEGTRGLRTRPCACIGVAGYRVFERDRRSTSSCLSEGASSRNLRELSGGLSSALRRLKEVAGLSVVGREGPGGFGGLAAAAARPQTLANLEDVSAS